MNILSLEDIGTELDVYHSGQNIGSILVIDYDDLIHGTIGEFDDRFESCADYSMELNLRVQDYVNHPHQISWYTIDADDSLDINDVASRAVRDGNKVVIIERLD